MRDVMLADDDFHVDTEVIRMAQDFDDASGGVAAVFGEFQDFDVHHHAVEILGTFDIERLDADTVAIGSGPWNFHAFGDVDPLIDTFVEGDDVGTAFADFEFTNDGEVCAAEDFDDLAIGAAIALDAGDVDHHAITVHGRLGGITDGTVRDQESVAIAMHVEAADGVLAAGAGGDEVAGADFDDFAFIGEPVERGVHFLARNAAGSEFADELFESGAGVGELGDVLEDGRVGHWDNYRARGSGCGTMC